MDQVELRRLWGQLSVEAALESERAVRGIPRSGCYASWNVIQQSRELLVRADKTWSDGEVPNWRGMAFSFGTIASSDSSLYVVMELLDTELEVPFACFCADVIESLSAAMPEGRTKALGAVIHVWDQFFLREGDSSLSSQRQRGLYAELWWLRELLVRGMPGGTAVISWMGPLRSFHDFDNCGYVVEVKSTISKEPRKVMISNERQLDDHGLSSLHLFVLTLNTQHVGETLPGIVEIVRAHLRDVSGMKARFDRKLVLAGYLDSDAEKYQGRYKIRSAELFEVRAGFPRLIKMPKGLGDLSYSLQISACKQFERDLEKHLDGAC